MTYFLLTMLIIMSIFLFLLIGIRVYANSKMEYLYDQLMSLQFQSNSSMYVHTFAELLRFRKCFYPFLNQYTRLDRFKPRYRSFKLQFPEICETLENLYLN